MGLFGGKPNGGGLMDVIRCDEPDYLIWKWHPTGVAGGDNRKENSIRWGSSLRVKEGSVAVFVYPQADGTMEEFIEGPFDDLIETSNFPVLTGLIGLAYNGDTPFQAEVYFINLAKIIPLQFAIPYFDIFDSRFPDCGVPTAVRGSFRFSISDYREFIKLHRLENFGLSEFERQIKDALIKSVKSVVINAPSERNIPIVQIESRIEEINNLVEEKIKSRMEAEFGVKISSMDISVIDIDKTSEGYRQLKEVTQDITSATMKAQGEAKVKDIKADQKIGVFDRAAKSFINAKEDQFEKHKRIKETNYSNSGELGRVFVGAVSGLVNRGKKNSDVATPPPIPTVSYHVAVDGNPTGPFNLQELKDMKNNGALSNSSLVWKEGMEGWEKAVDVEDLKELFPNIPPIPQ